MTGTENATTWTVFDKPPSAMELHWYHALDISVKTYDGAKATLIVFEKDGQVAEIDINDGVLTYSGDIEIDEAAKLLFGAMVEHSAPLLIEKFGRKQLREYLDILDRQDAA